MSIRNPTYHKIRTGGNPSEAERIMTIMFANGYIFGTTFRLKDLVSLKQKQCLPAWEYIRHGHDRECKYVVGCLQRDEKTIHNYILVTIEEFLEIKRIEERQEKEAEEKIENFDKLSHKEKNFAYNVFCENHKWNETNGWQKRESIAVPSDGFIAVNSTIIPTSINMNGRSYGTGQSVWNTATILPETTREIRLEIERQMTDRMLTLIESSRVFDSGISQITTNQEPREQERQPNDNHINNSNIHTTE